MTLSTGLCRQRLDECCCRSPNCKTADQNSFCHCRPNCNCGFSNAPPTSDRWHIHWQASKNMWLTLFAVNLILSCIFEKKFITPADRDRSTFDKMAVTKWANFKTSCPKRSGYKSSFADKKNSPNVTYISKLFPGWKRLDPRRPLHDGGLRKEGKNRKGKRPPITISHHLLKYYALLFSDLF